LIDETLRCVEIGAAIDRTVHFRSESVRLVPPDQIDCLIERKRRKNQHMPPARCEEVRAFPHLVVLANTPDTQQTEILPLQQAATAIQKARASLPHNSRSDDLAPLIALTPDTVVAKTGNLQSFGWTGYHRVARMFTPRRQIIAAGRNIRQLDAIPHFGIHQRGNAMIIHSHARPAPITAR
jgi:hypothetical protein